VRAWTEDVDGLASVKKDPGLALPGDKLRSPFDLARSFPGHSLDHLLPGLIKPFNDLQKNNIVFSHRSPLFSLMT
jgi:hypothetical protein